MKFLKSLLVAGVMVAPMGAVAKAADLDPAIPAETDALTGIYLRADAGWSFLEWSGGSDDNGPLVGGGIGYKWSDMFRTDLTVDWAGNYDVSPTREVSSTTILGNAYLDIANDTAFTPYVGLGAGYNFAKSSENGIALAGRAGVAVDLTQNMALDVGYKYQHTMVGGPDLKEHQAMIGLRFAF
jgi:opacity protein-like surface antigen